MASAGTAKPQGEGKELETTQEDPVEPEQPPIIPRAKDERSSNSHARRTSRKKKHRQARHKSRHGEWEPSCYTYRLYSLRASKVVLNLSKATRSCLFFHFWLSLPTSRFSDDKLIYTSLRWTKWPCLRRHESVLKFLSALSLGYSQLLDVNSGISVSGT